MSPPASSSASSPRQTLRGSTALPAGMATMRERIAVLSMNMFIRPEGIHSGAWFGAGDHKDLRTELLLRKIRDYDLVILQEMFELGVRQKRFVRAADAMGFRYHAGSVWPSWASHKLVDGGLLILSRYPIVERGQHCFTQGAGSDGMCAKGVLYARVQLSPDLADSLHVFTTHTQAGDHRRETEIRASQLHELTAFVATTLREDPYAPLLITGDFNLDARHDLQHTATGAPHAPRCRDGSSPRYLALFSELQGVLAAGRTLVDLIKRAHDDEMVDMADSHTDSGSARSQEELHPITNGDGHATLSHRELDEAMHRTRDGKCIDYMFFSAGIRQRRSISSGDIPNFHLRVLAKHTGVDHGDIASILSRHDHGEDVAELDPEQEEQVDLDAFAGTEAKEEEEDTAALLQRLPITHLSDHYGLRAHFELEMTPVTWPGGSGAAVNMAGAVSKGANSVDCVDSVRLCDILQQHFPPHAFAQHTKRVWQWKIVVALMAIAATSGSALVMVGSIVAQAVSV